jgi:GNAT superfamily N-acetyltransferase
MNLEIKVLTPDLSLTFINFFSELDFSHAEHWSACYCQYYYQDCDQEIWFKRTAQDNVYAAMTAIENHQMSGLLAFVDGNCVGWCNVAPLNALKRLSILTDGLVDQQVACTICFLIHPLYRGQGIASRLLAFAIEYYQQLGYDGMVALPHDSPDQPLRQYRGTTSMYQKAGYKQMVINHESLMYKQLK